MRKSVSISIAIVLSIALLFGSTASASEERDARKLCKNKITEVYGVNHFSGLLTDQIGNHKFKINGKVKFSNHLYPFNCKVKNGHIKSYAYNGPHDRHPQSHKDDDDNLGAAIAVGAGLAIIAAIAASSDNDHGGSNISTSKTVLEDDCHDMLQYRIKDEHDGTARVHMKSSQLSGHNLKGEIKVKYLRRNDQRGSYTCHFNRNGTLEDSSYHLY